MKAWIVSHCIYDVYMSEVIVDRIEGEKVYFGGLWRPRRRVTKHYTYCTTFEAARDLLRSRLEELITYHTERAQDLENQLCNMK